MKGIEDIGSRVEQPFDVLPLWQCLGSFFVAQKLEGKDSLSQTKMMFTETTQNFPFETWFFPKISMSTELRDESNILQILRAEAEGVLRISVVNVNNGETWQKRYTQGLSLT